MKRRGICLLLALMLLAAFSAAAEEYTPQAGLDRLLSQNALYVQAAENGADIGEGRRLETAVDGQQPYAVVVTCSDSRVPPEHIFLAGIGELFVVRTAGQVLGPLEIGSIEYGVEHLGAKVVLVMGHTGCGAVAATLSGHADGHIEDVCAAVRENIGDTTDLAEAEVKNAGQAAEKLLGESEILREAAAAGNVAVVAGIYDMGTGAVRLLEGDWGVF